MTRLPSFPDRGRPLTRRDAVKVIQSCQANRTRGFQFKGAIMVPRTAARLLGVGLGIGVLTCGQAGLPAAEPAAGKAPEVIQKIGTKRGLCVVLGDPQGAL